MSKALEEISSVVYTIASQNEKSYGLLQKAAKVTAIQAEGISSFLDQPSGRKGVVATVDMQKASDTANLNQKVYQVLMKAVYNKDAEAGQIISAFESAGKDVSKLRVEQRNYISELMQKEAI
jgi:hypothetical protein